MRGNWKGCLRLALPQDQRERGARESRVARPSRLWHRPPRVPAMTRTRPPRTSEKVLAPWLVGKVGDFPAGLRLARDADARDLLPTPDERIARLETELARLSR